MPPVRSCKLDLAPKLESQNFGVRFSLVRGIKNHLLIHGKQPELVHKIKISHLIKISLWSKFIGTLTQRNAFQFPWRDFRLPSAAGYSFQKQFLQELRLTTP